jgi:anti-sigma factor RsiW
MNTITDPLDDAVLAAYVDNEIDTVQRQQVMRAMGHDAELREKVFMMQEMNRLLRAAYSPAESSTFWNIYPHSDDGPLELDGAACSCSEKPL